MERLILLGYKHFASDLKTITVDNLYHPHATWSFPNGSLEKWASNLKVMTSKFEETKSVRRVEQAQMDRQLRLREADVLI